MTFFKLFRIVAIISAAVLFAVWPSFAGDSSKKATSKDNELAVAYSIAEPGTEVIAVLRNNLPDSELVIQPVLRSATGTETQGQSITLRAREVRHIPLAVLFSGITDDSGQLVLRFNSGDAQNVAASLMFRRGNKEVQAPLPAVDAAPRSDSTESRVLWYRPNATAAVYLVLANGARDAATVVVGGTQQIAIAPLTTVRVPLTADDRTSGAISVVAPATVSVTALATGGAIASTFSRRSPVSTKSASQRKPDPPPVVTLRSGPLAPGACSPERGYSVLLHNMSNAPIAARATLKEYRNGVSLPIDLLPLSIAPGATVTADFQVKGSDTASAWRAVDIDYTGGTSDLAAMVLAHRKAGVETQRLSASAGKSYVGTQWLSAAEASTAIRVVNVGRKPADYSVTFFAPDSSVVYQVKGPKLKPGEDALVDIAQLREQAIADPQGRRMPLVLEEGTFEVETSDTSNEALLFAAATSPSADPAAAPAPLGAYCCGRVAPYVQPYPMWVFLYEFSLASVYVQDTCTGQRRGTAASWWTDDTMIASVDSLGNVYGFGPGATNVDAEVELWLSGPFGCGDHWFETVYAPVYVAACNPVISTAALRVACDNTSTYSGHLTINWGNGSAPVVETNVSTSTQESLMIELLGPPTVSDLCSSPLKCHDQQFKARTGPGVPNAGSIDWRIKIWCSVKLEPDVDTTVHESVTCQ